MYREPNVVMCSCRPCNTYSKPCWNMKLHSGIGIIFQDINTNWKKYFREETTYKYIRLVISLSDELLVYILEYIRWIIWFMAIKWNKIVCYVSQCHDKAMCPMLYGQTTHLRSRMLLDKIISKKAYPFVFWQNA